jgi:hypothetical protein
MFTLMRNLQIDFYLFYISMIVSMIVTVYLSASIDIYDSYTVLNFYLDSFSMVLI